jgi:hypothetical protein
MAAPVPAPAPAPSGMFWIAIATVIVTVIVSISLWYMRGTAPAPIIVVPPPAPPPAPAPPAPPPTTWGYNGQPLDAHHGYGYPTMNRPQYSADGMGVMREHNGLTPAGFPGPSYSLDPLANPAVVPPPPFVQGQPINPVTTMNRPEYWADAGFGAVEPMRGS